MKAGNATEVQIDFKCRGRYRDDEAPGLAAYHFHEVVRQTQEHLTSQVVTAIDEVLKLRLEGFQPEATLRQEG
jgi:hypothetical protein